MRNTAPSTGPRDATEPTTGAFTYLDAASAEPLHPAAREAWLAAVDKGYADPRRLHGPGRAARLVLDNAREVVAECLGVRPDEVSFTRSGTDAIHRGLLGLARGRSRAGEVIAHSAVEHSSVLHAAAWRGTPTLSLPVGRTGRLDLSEAVTMLTACGAGVGVVALQSANHEVGTRQPVAEIAERIGEVPVFVDACASMGREPLPDGWAAAAGSAHKFGGPAGVGVLLVRKGARWRNPLPEDDRIDERGTGFEDVPGALATAAALQAVTDEASATGARQHATIDALRTAVARDVPDAEVVGEAEDRLPHLMTASFLYVDGEVLVHELDRLGFGVASGSACTSSTLAPSHVLEAMGVLTHGNLRVSLTAATPQDEVVRLAAVLPGVVRDIRAEAGL